MNTSSVGTRCSHPSTFDVYVGHVPKTIQQATLLEVFSKHGEVVDVLIRHAAGAYGYAIIKFKHKKDADKVLKKVAKVRVGNHEMEVKNGKRSSHSVESCNGATAMVKTVSFAEPSSCIQQLGGVHFMEPALSVKDCKYMSAYAICENVNASVPLMVEIMCTHVENAVTFHGCPIGRFEEMQILSTKLNSICPNLLRLPRKPSLNKIYGALYSEDHRWYRCCILQCAASANSTTCIVEYIDYGNVAEVSYTDMVELPEPIKKLNPFAVKCVFSNLVPSCKSQNISYLHHLINSRMSLCAISAFGIPEYQVLKCSCNGIDVIAELVRNGYAVYRSQASSKTSPSSNDLDKTSGLKSQVNHKTKKVNGTCVNRKAAGSCNGIGNHSYEVRKEGVYDQVKNGRSSSSITSQHAQDFVPKKIIKRGSDSCIVNHQVFGMKPMSDLFKIDSVISSVKLVNNIRGLLTLHASDDHINKAIDLLKNDMNVSVSDDLKLLVENAHKKYSESLKDIKDCSNQAMLLDLKEERNKRRAELCNELKNFLETFDLTLLEKRKRIQETITALESNSTAWLNVYLSRIPDTIEGLLAAYNEEKERKRNSIDEARSKTAEKYEKFIKVFVELQKELSLNMVDEKTDDTYFLTAEGKKGSWALKFEDALTEYGIALEAERTVSTEEIMSKDRSSVSVIQCILEKLDIPKEKIDAECELYEKYKFLYDDLTYPSDLNSLLDELHTLCKTIQAYGSCADNENAEEPSEKLFELHSALLSEDALLVDVAKAATRHFPEFVHEHPELKLEEYQKYFCLLKHSWDISFFPFFEKCSRIEPSYISKLADEFVVIKEFDINCDSENAFMKKVITWNEIRSTSLVKVKGLFKNKAGNIMYTVLPLVWETLYDKPLAVPVDYTAALKLLQQILDGLCDIHSRGIVHGAVHPMSILHSNGKVFLDFNFDKHYLQDKLCLKGINFQVPNGEDPFKSADMYMFGCIVLWVLFPNLSFSSNDEGVPDIDAFQSIIQAMLFDKDFSSLSALLNVNNDIRPSSRVLRSNGFLKDLRILSEAAS